MEKSDDDVASRKLAWTLVLFVDEHVEQSREQRRVDAD